MRITYDKLADAIYIYFTVIGTGGVAQTAHDQRIDFDLDEANQIVALRLCESEELQADDRLRFALQHPEVTYESGQNLQVSFLPVLDVKRTVEWHGNVDLDKEGQILGIEVLFGPKFTVADKLVYLREYLKPFSDSYLEDES